MATVVVRQAALSDIEELATLFDKYRQFYGRSSDLTAAREFLLDRFNHAESALFLARAGGMAVGFAQLYPSFSSVLLARTFILNDLFVREDFRRKGVARKIVSSTIDFARQLGAVRLTLCTAITNKEAQSLYEAAGWKRDEQFITYNFATAP